MVLEERLAYFRIRINKYKKFSNLAQYKELAYIVYYRKYLRSSPYFLILIITSIT